MNDEDVFASPNVEEQFILRVPKDLAKQIRKMLKNKTNLPLSFKMDTDHKGKFYCGEKEYDLTLANLQCILESHKTLDKKNFYKISDIGQIMVVKDPDAPVEDKNEAKIDYQTFDLDSGITPPTRHIRKIRWRKKYNYPRQEVIATEDELHKITKGHEPGEVIEFFSVEDILREQRENEAKSRADQLGSSQSRLKVKVNLRTSSASISAPKKEEKKSDPDETESSSDEERLP